ncbi:MAG: glycosyltransferase family 2 protein [bacterium]|nr:glycosyltransferase family 2 protein [bacterium]
MQPSYSIIVIAYNQPHLVERCIESIMQNGALISQTKEVILVNNGPEHARLPDGHEQFITVINNDKNLGFGQAVNQAAEIATGEYLFLLNSDAVLTDTTLKELTSFIRANPQASIVGTKQKTTQGKLVASFGNYPSAWRELAALTGVSKVLPVGRLITPTRALRSRYGRTGERAWVSGGAMIIKASDFERVGGFDPMYFLYVDDIDICRRVRGSAGQVWYCAEALVLHDYGSSGSREHAQRYTTQGLLYFAKKYGQAVKPLATIQSIKHAIRP